MDSSGKSGRMAVIVAIVIVLVLLFVWLRRPSAAPPACDASRPCPKGYDCVGGACEPQRCAELWPFARPTSGMFAAALDAAWAARGSPVTPQELAVHWDPSWEPVDNVLAWVRAAAGGDHSPPCRVTHRPGRPSECQLRLFASRLGWSSLSVCRPGDQWNDEGEVCGDDCRWRPVTCTLAGQTSCYSGHSHQDVFDFERYEGAWPVTHVVDAGGAPADFTHDNGGKNTWAAHALDVRPSLAEGPVILAGCEQACRSTPGCSGYSYDRSRRWCALWPAPADAGVTTSVTTTDFSGAQGSRPSAAGYVYGLNRNWQADLPSACSPATLVDSDGNSYAYGPQPALTPPGSTPPAGCWSTDLSAGEQVFTHGAMTGGSSLKSAAGVGGGTLAGCAAACRAADGCKYWEVPQGNVNQSTTSGVYQQYVGWNACNLYSAGTPEFGHDNRASYQVQFVGEV